MIDENPEPTPMDLEPGLTPTSHLPTDHWTLIEVQGGWGKRRLVLQDNDFWATVGRDELFTPTTVHLRWAAYRVLPGEAGAMTDKHKGWRRASYNVDSDTYWLHRPGDVKQITREEYVAWLVQGTHFEEPSRTDDPTEPQLNFGGGWDEVFVDSDTRGMETVTWQDGRGKVKRLWSRPLPEVEVPDMTLMAPLGTRIRVEWKEPGQHEHDILISDEFTGWVSERGARFGTKLAVKSIKVLPK